MDRPKSPPLTETDHSHYIFQQQYPTHLSRSKSPHSFVSAFASHATGDSSFQVGTQPLHLPSASLYDRMSSTVADQGLRPSFFEPSSDAFTRGGENQAFAPAYGYTSQEIEHSTETGPMFDNLSTMRTQESGVQLYPPVPAFRSYSSAGLPYCDDTTHPLPTFPDDLHGYSSHMSETQPAMNQQNSFATVPQDSTVPSALLASPSDPWWAVAAADSVGKGDLKVILEEANPENRPRHPYKRWIRITSRTRQRTVEVKFIKFRHYMHAANLAKLQRSLAKIVPYLTRMTEILPRDDELPTQIKNFDDQLTNPEFSNFLSAAYLRDLRESFESMHQTFSDHEEEKDRIETYTKDGQSTRTTRT
jgi:hypothetical protein